jgi:magnesium transporter
MTSGPAADILAILPATEKRAILGKELLMAEDDELLSDLMVENVISLNPETTMKQAADAFIRYAFRALPVTDRNAIILGVVPYRDVMNLKHRILE